jgi:hypothetical protein
LLARNGPFDVPPAINLNDLAGLNHARDPKMGGPDLGVGNLVRLPVLGKGGLHGRMGFLVGCNRRKDRIGRGSCSLGRGADRHSGNSAAGCNGK